MGTAMPINFLRKIEFATFPLLITAASDIRKVALLHTSLLLVAKAAEPIVGSGVDPAPVIVVEITRTGRAVLSNFRSKQSAD